MSVLLCIVHKQLGGHKWSNTHCIQVGSDPSAAPSSADLVTAGANSTLDATTTGTSPANILQAIVAFERLLVNPDVLFTDVLLTDGKRNTGTTPSTVYATITMNSLPGLAGTAAGTALEPGGIAWLVHRNVVGFSHKPGRLFVRGALVESSVSLGGPKMIQWEGTAATNWATQLATAQAKLTPYLYNGASAATAMYTLPLYLTPKQFKTNPGAVPVGTLYGAVPINGFSSVSPVLRQVQRGRKRKTTP